MMTKLMMTNGDAFCGNVTPIISLLGSKELRNFARKLGFVPNGFYVYFWPNSILVTLKCMA